MMTGAAFDDLRGKIALVTGSSRGIGAAIAGGLRQHGVRVFRHGVEREAAEDREDADYIAADLRYASGRRALVDGVTARVDRLDILINNAGLELHQRLDSLDESALRSTIEVNLLSPLLLSQSLLPLMITTGGGAIINVTSIHDEVPVAGNLAYMISKAALAGATRTMALELARWGIRVNTLAPGAIDTDMARPAIDAVGRERFNSWIPLGRVGDAAEIVPAAMFLASDASAYITGARLLIDGGYSLALLQYGDQKQGDLR